MTLKVYSKDFYQVLFRKINNNYNKLPIKEGIINISSLKFCKVQQELRKLEIFSFANKVQALQINIQIN